MNTPTSIANRLHTWGRRLRDLLGWDDDGSGDVLSVGLPARPSESPWRQAAQGIALVVALASVVIVVGLVVAVVAAWLF